MNYIEKSDWERDSLTDWPTISRIASATENHKFKDVLKYFWIEIFLIWPGVSPALPGTEVLYRSGEGSRVLPVHPRPVVHPHVVVTDLEGRLSAVYGWMENFEKRK